MSDLNIFFPLNRSTSLEITEPRLLTGEEQKALCKLATLTTATQLGIDSTDARCYISEQVVVPISGGRRLADGAQLYSVSGVAKLNFDASVPPEVASPKKVKSIMDIAKKKASRRVVKGAVPRTEAPSASPSMAPSISSAPTTETAAPTRAPVSPMGLVFRSADIGYCKYRGESFQTSDGLYNLKASGSDIWGSVDGFHYMYVETSGDADFSILIENFSKNMDEWAKGGVRLFVEKLPCQHYTEVSIFFCSWTDHVS